MWHEHCEDRLDRLRKDTRVSFETWRMTVMFSWITTYGSGQT